MVDNNPTLLNDLGNLGDDNIMLVTRILISPQHDQMGKIPAKKHKSSLKCQNEDLTLFDELKLNQKESIFVSAWWFTQSMAIVITPTTIQQHEDSLMVEIL